MGRSPRALDEIRIDHQAVRVALDRLVRKAEAAGMSRRRRFVRYLQTLDRMHRELGDLLEQGDDGGHIDDAAEGLKEVLARLAVARSAAESRFR
jgi:hypothetical protein